MDAFIQQLRAALQGPLPGRDAQFRMAHVGRRAYMEAPEDARKAAVLILLFPQEGAWHVALMERSSHNPNDRHGGQISFPGGSFDPQDTSLLHTALREAHEEMGIAPSEVEVLGALTDLYIPVSNFHVFPFVACIRQTPVFVPQMEEVRTVLTAPFSFFADEESVQITELVLAGGGFVLKDVPCYLLDGHVIWGATAMIMSELTAAFSSVPGNHLTEKRSV